jgi:hypothetical protein
MDPDTTYLVALGPDPARALLRAGLWEHALAAVPAGRAESWRAQILADRFRWQLADPAGAEAALAAADPVCWPATWTTPPPRPCPAIPKPWAGPGSSPTS